MKTKTCCFTGHRAIPPERYIETQKRLEAELITLISQGIQYFMAGGALGFDTMVAIMIIELRKKFPDIKLILALPCKEQTIGWDMCERNIYNETLKSADELIYTSEDYFLGCMDKRNHYMVDHSSICICYLTKTAGGTVNTVRYARQQGLQMINLAQIEGNC